MTVMNVVHMRVKPEKEAEFLQVNREFEANRVSGSLNFWVMHAGERNYVVVGEWQNMAALAAARPVMIANLDRLRSCLEDLGGGRGLTEPWSGEVAIHVKT